MQHLRKQLLAAIAIVMLTGNATAVFAEPPKTNPKKTEPAKTVQQRVEKQLEQLNSIVRKTRKHAEAELLKIGPDALPFLPPPELIPNISARDAIGRIRILLEKNKAEASVKPSHVTLNGTFTLHKILQEITKQTNNRFDLSALPKTVLQKQSAIKYQHQTFWNTIDQLAQTYSLTFQLTKTSERLKFTAIKPNPKKTNRQKIVADNRSAFRIAIESVTTKPLIGQPKKQLLRIRWTMLVEPRLQALFLKYSGKAIIASVIKPNQIKPKKLEQFALNASYDFPLGEGGRQLTLRSDFIVDAKKIPKTIQLEGSLEIKTAAARTSIRFRKLTNANGTAIRRGGVTVTLRKAISGKPNKITEKRTVQVSAVISYDVGGTAFESHRTWIFHNRVFLQQKDGTKIEKDNQFHTSQQKDGTIAVDYKFHVKDGDPKDDQFVYVAPTLLIDVPISFTLPAIPVTP